VPALARNSTRSHSTSSPTWPGWVLAVSALAGWHEAVLVVRLGVGVVARSTAAGEHQEEGYGINPASRSTVLQRAGAGQELDQLADVAGWVLVVAGWQEVVLVAGAG
jgi:hypothetical protein